MAQSRQGRQRQLTATSGERLVLGLLALFAAVGFVLLQNDTPVLAALGVAFASVLAFGTVRAHRGLMAIGAFLTAFGPWSFAYIFGAPFLACAAFLLWRANRLDNSV